MFRSADEYVGQPERKNKNLTVYSLFVMVKRDRIILHTVWERKLKPRESWNDSETTGHTASATVVMKHGLRLSLTERKDAVITYFVRKK